MSTTRTLSVVLGLACLLAGAEAARAALTTRIEAVGLSTRAHAANSDLVVVPNDGTSWLEPAESQVEFLIRGSAETTQSKYQIVRAYGSLAAEGYAGSELTLPAGSQWALLWSGETDKLHEQDFWYAFDVNPRRALNACRDLYTELSNGGTPRDTILGNDHWVRLSNWLYFAVLAYDTSAFAETIGSPQPNESGGHYIGGHWVWKRVDEAVRVKCTKFADGEVDELHRDDAPPRPPTDQLRVPFAVRKIEIGLAPREAAGVCPITLNVRVDVYTTAAGTARVRLHGAGAASPELPVHTKVHHTGAFIGTGYFTAEVGKSGKGGLKAVDPPGPKGPQLAVETQENVHRGVYWVESSGGVKSNHEGYRVTCTPPPFEPGLRGRNPNAPPSSPKGPQSLGTPSPSGKPGGKKGGGSGGPEGPSGMKAP